MQQKQAREFPKDGGRVGRTGGEGAVGRSRRSGREGSLRSRVPP